jgi:hypothetical protein
MSQNLVDRDCVLLDGRCKCSKPFEDCKYLKSEEIKKETEVQKLPPP